MRPFLSFQGQPIVSLSLSLSFHPPVLLLLSLLVGPSRPRPTRRATTNRFPFPKRSAAPQTTPLLHSPVARAPPGGGPRLEEHVPGPKPKLGAGRDDVRGDSRGETASRLSEGEGEGGRCCRRPPRPANLFGFSSSNFEFQFKNPTSFPVKVGTHRERERERADPVPVA